MPLADSASAYPGRGELQARTADLADAEARYHITVDEPAASEGDHIDAAEALDRAQTRMQELTWASREADAEAGLVAAREAWGPEWPAWLSMTDIEPGPEIDLGA
jgi:hypothetical protein